MQVINNQAFVHRLGIDWNPNIVGFTKGTGKFVQNANPGCQISCPADENPLFWDGQRRVIPLN
jgi:hypothetical protein